MDAREPEPARVWSEGRIRVASISTFVFGLIRTFALVWHRPVLGYGNNFDFYRVAQWFGVSSDPRSIMPPHIEAPVARYFWGAPRVAGDAYLSSELVFVSPALYLSRAYAAVTGGDPGAFDIRWVGSVRALALTSLFAVAMIAAWKERPRALPWIAAAFAFVVADPMCTLFLNTLYCEPSALIFAAASVLALLYIFSRDMPARAGRTSVAFGALSLLGLGLSKVQNQALPLALVATALAFGSPQRWREMRVVTAILLLSSSIPIAVQNRTPAPGINDSIVLANSADAWFGAILPSLADPAEAVAELGLPARCAGAVGHDYYDEPSPRLTCPEIRNVSRLRALPLLASEPSAAARMMLRALRLTMPWNMLGYGHVEGRRFGRLANVSPLLAPGVLDVLRALPRDVLTFLTALAMLLPLLALALHRRTTRHIASQPGPEQASFLAAQLGVVVAYSLMASVSGDGFYALHHHYFLGSVALLPALVAGTWTVRRRAA